MAPADNIAASERIIRDHVFRPYEREYQTEPWRDLPEVPDKAEIMPKEDDDENESKDFFENWDKYQDDPQYNTNLPENIVQGPWPSKEAYIAAHYQILREDAIASLRSSVRSFKRQPDMGDDKFTHVYTHVHVKGLTLGPSGAAFRIEFSHDHAEKQIRWEQSTRLQQGTMVALTPMWDSFRSTCKIAIVAARPYRNGLDQNPPEIDIFWGDPNDAVIDPVEPYVMIESRGSYFEASRHMLVALQKLRTEPFHLSKHLVELDPHITAPDWLEAQRFLDLSSLEHPQIDPVTQMPIRSPSDEVADLYNADVLEGFPNIPSSGMDKSQMAACERMITKKVSIVQGPPGTGKTFTSVSALRILIDNLEKDSPPVIIAAQTNHALDQLINHVMAFEPNVVRLGGRSDRENVDIVNRTLYVLKKSTPGFSDGWKFIKAAKNALENKIQEIQMAMVSLLTENLLCDEALLKEGIITESQKESLYGEGWANGEDSTNANHLFSSPLGQWVGSGNLAEVPRAPLINMGLPLEEGDEEYEQLQHVELESKENAGDKETEEFRGTKLMFVRKLTGRSPPGADERKLKKKLSSTKDLYDIPMGMRGQMYRDWEKRLNKSILAKLKEQLREYKELVDGLRVAKWVNHIKLIRHLGIKVIGCTTTGLSKYRGLLAALKPRTLLIEEAAETLEGTVMAGMFESLEQLMLVGDHQQLQAHATLRALEAAPYNLSISMFERLVNNAVGYTMLNEQRRMIPDIRKLLCIQPTPFYADLHDHPSVLDRKNRLPIPGMGGKDTYFFHHNWPEQRNADQSRYNIDEAEMIAGFFNHLVMNGTECSKITVLTFYNGQRKAILKELKHHPSLGVRTYFNVFTIDSYQGEENDVVLLSLVRSNDHLSIGFLENKNRLVVALSRARRGLYIFGNATTLTSQETPLEDSNRVARDPMWQSLLCHMRDNIRFDLEGGLPITCTKHGKTIRVYEANQFVGLAGGCHAKCDEVLQCGHPCPHPCHPFDHDRVICGEACDKILKCGHGCSGPCGEECYCSAAECALSDFDDMDLGGGQSTYDKPVVGDAVWKSPTNGGKQGHNASFRLGGITAQGNNRIISASQDIRNNMPRNSFRPNTKRATFAGKSVPKFDVSSDQRNASSAKPSPTHQSSIESWKNWNAKKADQEARDNRDRMVAENEKIDKSTWVFKDTWKATKIENGVRVSDPASSSQTLIPRFAPSPLATLEVDSNRSGSQVLLPSAAAAASHLHKALTETDPFVLSIAFPKLTPAILPKNALTKPSKPTQVSSTKPISTSQSKPTLMAPLKPISNGPSKPVSTNKATPTGLAKQTYFQAYPKQNTKPDPPKQNCTTKSACPSKSVASSNDAASKNVAPSKAGTTSNGSLNGATTSKATAPPMAIVSKISVTLKPATATTPTIAITPSTVATGPSNLPIAALTPFLGNNSGIIAPARLSANLTDLLGLEILPSLGTSEDFDEFEKRFG